MNKLIRYGLNDIRDGGKHSVVVHISNGEQKVYIDGIEQGVSYPPLCYGQDEMYKAYQRQKRFAKPKSKYHK